MASINYRYSTTDILPAPVHDAARAVQFLRSKAAEWQLDPRRFGAYGISAGATTSLWLAYHDDLADAGSADPIARCPRDCRPPSPCRRRPASSRRS